MADRRVSSALLSSPRLFADGRWINADADRVADVVEAATEQVIGIAPVATQSNVDEAVGAARAALGGPWGDAGPDERADALDRLADALADRGRATAALVSRENGMPISLSKRTNGIAPAAIMRYYAALVRGSDPEEYRAGYRGGSVVRAEPVGVVAAIVPWNYPQALAAMKIAPALASGCTVILKPALETALDSLAFAEAAVAADLPRGVLNVIPGDVEAGAHLVSHSGVDKVAFTGSTAAGRSIAEVCGRLLRPVSLELGGKSAAIVAEDADLDAYASALPEISFANNGQTCHICSRILAPESRYEEVVEATTETAKDLLVGDPLDPEVEIGPLVSEVQRERVRGFIEMARASDARLTVGGDAPAGLARGWFIAPTVFADVHNSHPIAQEEVFGPVVTVIPYDGLDDAVAIANDSQYGLAGTVWSADPQLAMEIARRVHTGSIGINEYSLRLEAPFGGVKASGLGRELGPEGLEPYRELKSIYTSAEPDARAVSDEERK